MRSDAEWKEILSSLEYLDGTHRELFSFFSAKICNSSCYDKILEHALAYFIYRHCSEAHDESEYRSALGMCLLLERLLASLLYIFSPKNFEAVIEIARVISEEVEYSEENTDAIKFEFFCIS